jgi:pyrroloquinoline quinone biosynthesis protein D
VLLFPEGLIKLPGSAGEIIKRVDGTRTAEDIVKDLEASFPGVELKNDVVEFLEIAHAKGWIRVKANQ